MCAYKVYSGRMLGTWGVVKYMYSDHDKATKNVLATTGLPECASSVPFRLCMGYSPFPEPN